MGGLRTGRMVYAVHVTLYWKIRMVKRETEKRGNERKWN